MATLHTPVEEYGAGGVRVDGGVFILAGATNTFTGGINLQEGLAVIKGEIAPGGEVGGFYGSLDLDGQDLLGRNLWTYIGGGFDGAGAIRNQNPDRRSRISGNLREMSGDRWSFPFGGVGDILYTGVITDTTPGINLYKAGPGTLTLAGATLNNAAPTGVLGGALVLDHETDDSPKISENAPLLLAGNFTLLGSPAGNTVQTVGDLWIGSDSGDRGYVYNRVRISPKGNGIHSATLRFGRLSCSDANYLSAVTADFAPGDNGFILANNTFNADVFTNAAKSIKALSPRFTWKGGSFARVADAADGDGYRAIGPVPDTDYFQGLDNSTAYDFVDLPAGSSTNTESRTIAALRFNGPGPATLTLGQSLRLAGENYYYFAGGLLVTANAGPVEINGPGLFNWNNGEGGIAVHQYNTNAALTINAQVGVDYSCMGFTKSGPGELVLTHPGSHISRLGLFEGTLTCFSIGNYDQPSSIGHEVGGHARPLILGDATLRYAGGGDSTDRRFRLVGFGVIEAEGSGSLVFTHESPVLPNGGQLLTLSGSKEGVFEGSLSGLGGGRLRKRGSGTWTLNGATSIIWGGEVFDGTLVLDGSFGRDLTVHGGGVLAGKGRVNRDLVVKDGGAVSANPETPGVLRVGHNLVIENGAKIILPRKLPSAWVVVLKVDGEIIGEFAKPVHAHMDHDRINGLVSVKHRPVGTLLMVR